MRAFFLQSVIALSLLGTGAGACNSDGTVLWYDQPGGSGGNGGSDQTTGSATSGAGGLSLPWPSTGASITGGEQPEVVICHDPEDPNEPICTCPPGAICLCEPSPVGQPCDMTCPAGGCTFDCPPDVPCNTDCQGGCIQHCQPFSTCTLSCFGGGCDMFCASDATCYLGSFDGPSQMICDAGATCNCFETEGCFCIGPDCPQQPQP